MKIKTYTKNNRKIHEIGYDSRTGIEQIYKSIDSLIELEQNLFIHIVPKNIIPSIERTVNDFEVFEKNIKNYLNEKKEGYSYELSFCNSWENYCDIKINKASIKKEVKNKEKENNNLFNNFNILKKIEERPKEQEQKQEVEIINNKTINKDKIDFSILEKPIRCGFEEIHEDNIILESLINKSGVLKNQNNTTIIMNDNNGSINIDNGLLIFSSEVNKGTVIFNKTNITEALPEKEACVVFLGNNEIIIKKL